LDDVLDDVILVLYEDDVILVLYEATKNTLYITSFNTFRPTQSIMYIPLLVNRFQNSI